MGSQLLTTHSTFYYWGRDGLNCLTLSFLLLSDCLLANYSTLLHSCISAKYLPSLLASCFSLTLTHSVTQSLGYFFSLSSFPSFTPHPHSPPVLSLSLFHHSQKMLVMSESRLKIQITSGAEIRTNDQDTPLNDWRSLVTMAPTNPVLALVLFSSSSSSSRDFLNNKAEVLDTEQIQIPPAVHQQKRCQACLLTWIWLPGSM